MTQKLFISCLSFLSGAGVLSAQEFAEPPVLLYGKVHHAYDGYELLLQEGELEWTIVPANDPEGAFAIPGELEDIGGEFSYRVEVPVERVPDGFSAEAAITAGPEESTYDAEKVTVDGREAELVFPDGGEVVSTIAYSERDRGKIRRFDVVLMHPFEDTSGDGLPDWWAEMHGLDPYDPTEAERDHSGDGITAIRHYEMRTNPNAFFLTYQTWAAEHGLEGAEAAPGADPDGDGFPNLIEFLLDTDPVIPDGHAAVDPIAKRQAPSGKGAAFRLEWAQPDPPRWGVKVAVEASANLDTWETVWEKTVDAATSVDEVISELGTIADDHRFYRLAVRLVEAD